MESTSVDIALIVSFHKSFEIIKIVTFSDTESPVCAKFQFSQPPDLSSFHARTGGGGGGGAKVSLSNLGNERN